MCTRPRGEKRNHGQLADRVARFTSNHIKSGLQGSIHGWTTYPPPLTYGLIFGLISGGGVRGPGGGWLISHAPRWKFSQQNGHPRPSLAGYIPPEKKHPVIP